jgi:zinc transport system permease protein
MVELLIHYAFMRHALLGGLIIGFIAPLIGVFLVVRRMSMIADALSHVTLTGIAFSMLLASTFLLFQNINPMYTGVVFAIAGALIIDRLRESYRFYQELPIPIILSVGIGLSVVFISLSNGFNADLFGYLFGSIIAISESDLTLILVIGVVVLLIVFILYKELFALSFDDEHAQVSGIPRRWINLIFILLVALVIASAMRIVGVLLVSALMTLPVAAAIRLAKSFKQCFVYSILFGELSVLAGLYISYVYNLAPGGTIVVISFLILGVVLFGQRVINRIK